MITKKLRKQVIKEALNLRKYATKEEISKLNINTLNTMESDLCIYGQMTGDCFSERAIELLNKCAKPISNMCGQYIEPFYKKRKFEYTSDRYFSAIELYINLKGAKKDDLINLIKS